MLRHTLAALAALALTCTVAHGQDADALKKSGTLLYASFDRGARPDFFAGRDPMAGVETRGETVDGVRGKAWSGPLTWHAAGNVDAERGTIAFYARRPDLLVLSREWGASHRMLTVAPEGNALRAWALDLAGFARGSDVRVDGIDLAQWRHYALVWDRLHGVRFFIDGRLAGEDWGPGRGWLRLLTPCAITTGKDTALDELYVFDHALAGNEVIALMQGRLPRPAPPQLAVTPRVIEEIGFRAAGADLFAIGRKPLIIRQVQVRDAMSRKVRMTWAHDGRNHPSWPDVYTSEHEILDVYPEDEPFNYVTLDGLLSGVRVFELDKKSRNRRALFSVPAGQARWYGRKIDERTIKHLQIQRPRGPAGAEATRVLNEVRLFNVGRLRYIGATGRVAYGLGEPLPPEKLGDAGARLLELVPRRNRKSLTLIPGGRAHGGTVELGPLASLQLIGKPSGKRFHACGLLVDLIVESPHEDDVLEIVLREPADGFRELLRLPLRLELEQGRGRVDLCIMLRGFVLDKGERLWLSLGTLKGGLKINAGFSRIMLLGGEPATVRREAVEDLFQVAQKLFAWADRAHPWGLDFEKAPLTQPYGGFCASELDRLLRKVLALEPDHFEARATFAEIHARPLPAKRLSFPLVPGVPAWAVYGREVLRANLRISHWWHDKRLMAGGRLGGTPVGDTRLAARQALGGALGDTRTLELMQRVADADGLNSLLPCPSLLVLRYGAPRNILRTFERRDDPRLGELLPGPLGWAWYSGDPAATQRVLQTYSARTLSTGPGTWPRQLRYTLYLLSGDRTYLVPGELSPYYRETPPAKWRHDFKADADRLLADAEKDRAALRYESRLDEVFALAFVQTGDKRYLTEGLRIALEELAAGREYLDSTAGRPTGRFSVPPGSCLLGEMFCGGCLPDRRTALLGGMRVTWDGLGDDVVAIVTRGSPTGLRISACNFSPVPRTVGLRAWRLQRGDYALSVGPDRDDDGTADSMAYPAVIADVRRGRRIRVPLLPGLNVITLGLANPLPPLGRLPDPAVDAAAIVYDPRTDTVEAKVYNLGAVDAHDVIVTLSADGRVLRQVKLERIAWPGTQRPAPGTVRYPGAAALDARRLRVTVAMAGDEITTENNTAEIPWGVKPAR